jgi:glutathione S-transferase
MDKVKLHRCSYTFVPFGSEPCRKVQNALDEAGVPYEIVKEGFGKGKRPDIQRLTGQNRLPVIEFASGNAYREESKDMAATIAAGQLESKDVPKG